MDHQDNIIDIRRLDIWEQVWIHSGIILDDDWNFNSPKNKKRKREDDAELEAKIPRFNSILYLNGE